MSTKEIRSALAELIERLEDRITEAGNSKDQQKSYERQLATAVNAMLEVKYIESAARDLIRCGVDGCCGRDEEYYPAWSSACGVLHTIAGKGGNP